MTKRIRYNELWNTSLKDSVVRLKSREKMAININIPIICNCFLIDLEKLMFFMPIKAVISKRGIIRSLSTRLRPRIFNRENSPRMGRRKSNISPVNGCL